MRNKAVVITSLICAVLFLGAITAVLYQNAAKTGNEIEIVLDGQVIYSGSATHAGEPLYIEAVGRACTNRICIDEQGVFVESSDCPNGECVNMGYLKSRYLPIVCLPNNMLIRFTDGSDTALLDDTMDAISQ